MKENGNEQRIDDNARVKKAEIPRTLGERADSLREYLIDEGYRPSEIVRNGAHTYKIDFKFSDLRMNVNILTLRRYELEGAFKRIPCSEYEESKAIARANAQIRDNKMSTLNDDYVIRVCKRYESVEEFQNDLQKFLFNIRLKQAAFMEFLSD